MVGADKHENNFRSMPEAHVYKTKDVTKSYGLFFENTYLLIFVSGKWGVTESEGRAIQLWGDGTKKSAEMRNKYPTDRISQFL